MTDDCDPTYGKVDRILELLTKSKSLHILMVLDRSDAPLRFTEIKSLVDASSTTVSRRIKELEDNRLIVRSMNPESPQNNLYALSEDGRRFLPNSLFFCGFSNESAFGGNLVAEVVENGGFSGRARVDFPDALDVDASAGHPVTGAEQRVDLVGRRIGILSW